MLEILVCCEAAADFRIATELADRVCIENSPEWIADNLEYLRVWRGIKPGSSFMTWPEVKRLAKEDNIRFFGYRPEKSTRIYVQTRKLLLLALKQKTIRAIILTYDGDSNYALRLKDINAALQDHNKIFTVIIGVADTKREAWVLNGFVPDNKDEEQKLADLRRELGFDPCLETHRLRTISQEGAANRHVKRVLDELTDGNYERERRCWTQTPLAILRERGQNTGLTDYLDEFEEKLVPLLSAP